MFDKLLGIEARFESVNEQLCDPATVGDQQIYTKLMKELKQLTPVVEKFREYKGHKETFEESKMLLDEGGMDKDFKEMVQEEFETAKEMLEVTWEELKILLLPVTLMMTKTLLLKSVAVQVVKRQPFLQIHFLECTQCMPRLVVGKWKFFLKIQLN